LSQVVLSKLTKCFRIVIEESFKHERLEVRNPDSPWYDIFPCQGFKPGPPQAGPFIGLYSDDPTTIPLYTRKVQNAKNIWEHITGKPNCRPDFYFDREGVIFFPPEQPDLVTEGAKARRKRQGRPMTPEQKVKLTELGGKAHKQYRHAKAPGSMIYPN
jgi:hypothetical protein